MYINAGMFKQLLTKIRQEYFLTTFLSIIINPFYFTRKGLKEAVEKNCHFLHGTLLDFGCGEKPYQSIIKVDKYVGLDIAESGHDHQGEDINVYYDGKKIPFAEAHFDSIFTSEVLEHVFNIDEILQELHRVLKPQGKMLITCPFVWDEHEIPYDFGRYSSYGLKHLLEKNGFKVIHSEKSSNYLETVFQMLNAYLFQFTTPPHLIFKIPLILLVNFPINVMGIVLSKLLPKSNALYLDNVMIAEKVASS